MTPSTVTRPPRRFPTDRLPDGGLLISRCGGVPALSWPVSTSPVCAAARLRMTSPPSSLPRHWIAHQAVIDRGAHAAGAAAAGMRHPGMRGVKLIAVNAKGEFSTIEFHEDFDRGFKGWQGAGRGLIVLEKEGPISVGLMRWTPIATIRFYRRTPHRKFAAER